MPILNRLRSALRYFNHADPIYRWRLSRACCPNCEGQWFLSLRPDAFMTRCLSCGANVTNLSLIPVIQMHRRLRRIDTAWEMSTYGATLAYLRRTVREVHASEYFPGEAPGARIGGVMNQDVQQLSFADESLDLITSNQVFEHVADDRQGFRECFRVLRPGGALIFSVPLYDTEETEQLAAVQHGELVYFKPREFHDSRRDGPGSALCFWRHSFNDIAARVAEAGFVTRLIAVRLPPALKEATYVVYARKSSATSAVGLEILHAIAEKPRLSYIEAVL